MTHDPHKESPAGLQQWLSENELKPYLGLLDRAQKAESALVKINKLCDDIELCSDVRYTIQQIVKETATNLQQESPAGSALAECYAMNKQHIARIAALERELAEARESMPSADNLARKFHAEYERLAPSFSYVTRKDSRVPFDDLPTNNKALMIAVCKELREWILHDSLAAERKETEG